MNWKIHASSGDMKDVPIRRKNPAKCFSLSPLFAPAWTLDENSGIEKGVYEFIGKYTVGRPVMNKKLVMFFTRKEEDIKTGLNSGRKQLSMKFTVAWWGEADMGSN
ncbi:hypothetical protein T03_9927 [Trichinella britovi]|uniref:Uncharacterized protein n=1 Tax=Trichinella britovi TaxID=45882 RepID=A0A0V1D335_TRIBR|nr:hypothetical protein T09_10340 [Trichinella sp. T9]KRY55883.1 hypothetical protein T03_9927 [Trichinella britovi]